MTQTAGRMGSLMTAPGSIPSSIGAIARAAPGEVDPQRSRDLTVRAVSDDRGDTIVSIDGELDVNTSTGLREQLVELIEGGHRQLVLDLHGLRFVDSCGLGVLVGALKRAHSVGGDVRLARVPDRIRRVLSMTGLAGVFTVSEAVPLYPSG